MCGFSGSVETVLAQRRFNVGSLEACRNWRDERANVVENIAVNLWGDLERNGGGYPFLGKDASNRYECMTELLQVQAPELSPSSS